ncbi:MAG: hypothetical protein OXH81_09790, partial [Gemmatimonadetes bacterium]|nr:hypothetical protein [Gemmatimonadota bacterium]
HQNIADIPATIVHFKSHGVFLLERQERIHYLAPAQSNARYTLSKGPPVKQRYFFDLTDYLDLESVLGNG